MNVYQEIQTSGNQWPPPIPTMLHQEVQESPLLPDPKQGVAILDDLEKQMAAFAAEYETVLEEVRKHFVLPTDSSVGTFLFEHRTLPQILLEAVPQLRACFGVDALFNLRAPIDESGSRTLYAVAMWPGNIQDVHQALARFDDTWWIAHSRKASGYLTFTYELV
jgi:hypothetical protein